MSDNVKVVVTFDVLEEKLEIFEGIMTSLKTDLPKVDGCNSIVIHRDQDDACVFVLVEDWDNRETHDAHIATVVESGGWATIEAMLKSAPVTRNMSVY